MSFSIPLNGLFQIIIVISMIQHDAVRNRRSQNAFNHQTIVQPSRC